MKNPLGRLFSAIGGTSAPAPAPGGPGPRPALPPASPSPPPLEVQRAEAAVMACERAEAEAQAALAAARMPCEAAERAHQAARRALHEAEDVAASAPDDERAASTLAAAQQAEARAAGILASFSRRHDAAGASLEKARAALAAARTRLEGARADADRAEAEGRIVRAGEDAQKASAAYVATHPGPKLAVILDMSRKAFGEARARAGALRAEVFAALDAGEAGDRRALAAEPHRAREIKAEAEERRAAARAVLESLADVERWYAHAAPAVAMLALAGELEREARGMLGELAAEAHEAGVDARKVGSEFEPVDPKLAEAAVILGRFLGATAEDRAEIERRAYAIDMAIMRALSTNWAMSTCRVHEGNHGRTLTSEERARLLLRDPGGKPRAMLRADHARLVAQGDRAALEYEEKQGRGTDPRLAAMRAEDERNAAEARERGPYL
ncbi:hypothetical protein KEG38_43085 [Polyangium jinanense]|uniref:hypothetical protein n=1 Tax=Polyangium jinanense TaxID=2829994 RepID=UPI0023426040|nr:hypothetical protein [Polyangium jinanense]MDC3960716.1 hypothetical protein [Polyangium jinanense]